MKVLLIEDDIENATDVMQALDDLGYQVDWVATGRDGAGKAIGATYDAIVLDRMLPDLDGLAVLKLIRARGVETPTLFLTNLSGVDDRIEGLEAGGDDYLVKPFVLSELTARVAALGRRKVQAEEHFVLRVADLELNLVTRKARRGSRSIDLQPREFQLLEYFMRQNGRVVTRTMLLEGVWKFHFDPKTNIVETHISRLRTKIDKGLEPILIHTIRNRGYTFRAPL